MSDIYHRLTEASRNLASIRSTISVKEIQYDNGEIEYEVLQALYDEADDLEATVLDLEDEIIEMEEAKHQAGHEFE